MANKRVEVKQEETAVATQTEQETYNEPINCLRNERVIVRYILRPSSMVPNKNHVLYGGMAETAIRRADAAVGFLKIMNNTIKQNRDELDVLVPEFTKLKQWSYYYVQYMPRKEHHALEKKDVASPSVQG